MQKIINAIEDEISFGILSFNSIAKKYNVDLHFVNLIWDQMCERED